MRAIRTADKIVIRLLHYLIEREILITKNYFLASPNVFFGQKRTHLFSKCTIFSILSLFPDSPSKIERRQVFKLALTPEVF
jgi:hypothetical protein